VDNIVYSYADIKRHYSRKPKKEQSK